MQTSVSSGQGHLVQAITSNNGQADTHPACQYPRATQGGTVGSRHHPANSNCDRSAKGTPECDDGIPPVDDHPLQPREF